MTNGDGNAAELGYDGGSDGLEFRTQNTARLFIGDDGKVGIGTTSPQYALDVVGVVRGTSFETGSDRRWKEEIVTLENSLERVTQLRGVSFHWKDTTKGEGPQVGLIAQEVEAVFPELVSTDSDGYKSVSYDKLVAPLIEAVKELKAENDLLQKDTQALKADNEMLNTRNDDLERRLEALEAAINLEN